MAFRPIKPLALRPIRPSSAQLVRPAGKRPIAHTHTHTLSYRVCALTWNPHLANPRRSSQHAHTGEGEGGVGSRVVHELEPDYDVWCLPSQAGKAGETGLVGQSRRVGYDVRMLPSHAQYQPAVGLPNSKVIRSDRGHSTKIGRFLTGGSARRVLSLPKVLHLYLSLALGVVLHLCLYLTPKYCTYISCSWGGRVPTWNNVCFTRHVSRELARIGESLCGKDSWQCP